jgi:mono/diheme cytochrome c family protein
MTLITAGSVAGGALAATILAAAAVAQEPGKPDAGKELASQLCSTCHIVGTEQVGSDVAPPFPVLAKDPEMTFTELRGWIGPMHPILPNLALTPKQIADINAYLDSLRPPGEDEPPAGEPDEAATDEPPPALEDAPPERIGDPIEITPEEPDESD